MRSPSTWYLSNQNRALASRIVADFVAAVIEDHRAPVRMLALPRILVFIQGRAVKATQTVPVTGKMGRDPIDDDPDTVAMAVIDEIHEIFGRAVAAGGRVVADD